jgi:dihydrofolate reductase
MVRVPPERSPGARMELRLGDATANPYLAMAALGAAVFLGVTDKIEPGDKLEGYGYDPARAQILPVRLADALDALGPTGSWPMSSAVTSSPRSWPTSATRSSASSGSSPTGSSASTPITYEFWFTQDWTRFCSSGGPSHLHRCLSGSNGDQQSDQEPRMRRIINSTYISLDGVIADPQDWPDNGIEPDGTGGKVQTDLLFACDGLLMGARTYPGMASAWMARSGDPFSDRINAMTKYVVSSTLRDPEWNNTTVLSGDPIAEIACLKDQPGQDIVQYGFGQLSYALLEHGLLDELRLWVHPLFVGGATAADLLFRPAATAQLQLAGTLALDTGTVILTYRVPRS